MVAKDLACLAEGSCIGCVMSVEALLVKSVCVQQLPAREVVDLV